MRVLAPRQRLPPSPGDDEVATRLRAGDEEAWEELYARLYPRLIAYASSRVGRDRAGDAVAETMSRAVRGIGRYRPRVGRIDAWLFGICRHVVLDMFRDDRRRGAAPPSDPPDPDPGPLDQVMAREEVAEIRQAFARLSDDDRELLELRVVGELSSEEVAAVFGKRPGAVRMAQSRALQRLRLALEEVEG